MNNYAPTNKEIWTGRLSDRKLYLHEKVQCINLTNTDVLSKDKKAFGLVGYACDEGVRRNQGRVGAVQGPEAIRKILGKLPNHLAENIDLLDCGSIICIDGDMENAQKHLSEVVTQLLEQNIFPILLGGGHDIAYGHYNGIKNYLPTTERIGIINFDAHFDLRSSLTGTNSGTPFYQISEDCKSENIDFNYLCIGIRQDANDRSLFETADDLGVNFIETDQFCIENAEVIVRQLLDFIGKVDHIYLTIDLDGFSSAYAPGVSAPSPMGFSPDMVLKALQVVIASKKLISADVAELNPNYDIDNHTSKLAASLIHSLLHSIASS
jgi:formiminoglutamase